MLQNHMMQLLALVAMEPPSSFDAQSVRDEKAKVLRSIKPFTPVEVAQNVIRGQYGPGAIFGKPVPGYRQEQNIPPDSDTETYVAARFFIDNWRWSGVPFYLRHGKRLPKRVTEIAIQFRPAPLALFQHTAADELQPNVLVLHIQPDEGISIKFESKLPGQDIRLRSVDMNFNYGSSFGIETSDAYERLLWDAMVGDFDALHPPRRSRAHVDDHHLHPRRLAACPTPHFPQLSSRKLGSKRSRRIHRP